MFSELKEFSDKVALFKDRIKNESQTRTALIEPVIRILGYDTSNPFEVIPEFTCDVGIKKGEKVDYALVSDGEVGILIESKDCKFRLSDKNIGQLFRYYSVSSARVAILTNGFDYWFFADTVKQNVMDDKPFFIFNILEFSRRDVDILSMFSHENFDYGAIKEFARTSSIRSRLMNYFVKQSMSPSNDFIAFVAESIGVKESSYTDIVIAVKDVLSPLLGDMRGIVVKSSIKSTRVNISSSKDKSVVSDRLIGVFSLDYFTPDNIRGTKPVVLSIKKRTYKVNGWRSVFVTVFQFLFDTGVNGNSIRTFLDEEESVGWFGLSYEGMRSPKELQYPRLFIDTHGSAWVLIQRVKLLCSKLGIPDVLVKLE